MTTMDDMRTIRDALEQVVKGGLPTWYEATTILGSETQLAARSIAEKYIRQLYWRQEHEQKAAQIDGWLNDARDHADLLTRQVQALEAEVERLKAEQKR